jgi:gamma-glutamylcyclotransferase (GGCT)/AIG2-like uncharacterized protein YtfP
MCQSQAQGGKRCAAHTDIGVAATHYAKAITDLDDAQVSSIFHRLRTAHKDDPAPTAEEAVATLTRLRREALEDTRLTEATAYRLTARYDQAIAAIEAGELPDGRTWAAMQATPLEAEIAERNLTSTVRSSARHQRKSEERLAATFRKWRRNDNYEDLESPDPAYRLDPSRFPADKHTQRALRKLGFENYLAQRMPVFVYGTLRNNQGNDRLMDGAIAQRSEDAQVDGIAVYGAGRGFPYAQEAPDGQGFTKGDLVYLTDDHDGDWARQSLDNLEGFDSDSFNDSHYRRVAQDVTYTDPDTGERKTVKAWTYLAGNWSRESLTEEDRIHSGDWVQARNEHRNQRSSRPAPSYSRVAAAEEYTGDIVYTKRATDSNEPAHSAADAAAVFASAGLIDEEPDENAGFWSQYR